MSISDLNRDPIVIKFSAIGYSNKNKRRREPPEFELLKMSFFVDLIQEEQQQRSIVCSLKESKPYGWIDLKICFLRD